VRPPAEQRALDLGRAYKLARETHHTAQALHPMYDACVAALDALVRWVDEADAKEVR
jgi:hypothetical protein